MVTLPLQTFLRSIKLERRLDDLVSFKLLVSRGCIFNSILLRKHKTRFCIPSFDKVLQELLIETNLSEASSDSLAFDLP
jgi:hypothetical protein